MTESSKFGDIFHPDNDGSNYYCLYDIENEKFVKLTMYSGASGLDNIALHYSEAPKGAVANPSDISTLCSYLLRDTRSIMDSLIIPDIQIVPLYFHSKYVFLTGVHLDYVNGVSLREVLDDIALAPPIPPKSRTHTESLFGKRTTRTGPR